MVVTVVAAAGGCAITVFSVRVRLTGLASIVTFVVSVACSSLNRVVATSGSASSIASSAFSTMGKRPLSIRTHIFRMLLSIRSFCVTNLSRSLHCLQASATTRSANGSSNACVTFSRISSILRNVTRSPLIAFIIIFAQKAVVQSLAEMLAFVCLAAHLLPLVGVLGV